MRQLFPSQNFRGDCVDLRSGDELPYRIVKTLVLSVSEAFFSNAPRASIEAGVMTDPEAGVFGSAPKLGRGSVSEFSAKKNIAARQVA